MKMHCEVCGIPATHVCSGLEVPAVYFCREHGEAHTKTVQCGGTLREMSSRSKNHRMSDDTRLKRNG